MDLWNNDTPIADLDTDIVVPAWIESDISPHDVAAIYQGGCDSGAYMPAVTYSDAKATMAKHGDDVLQYIDGPARLTMRWRIFLTLLNYPTAFKQPRSGLRTGRGVSRCYH